MKPLGLRFLFFGLLCFVASSSIGQDLNKPLKTVVYDFVKKPSKDKKFIYGVTVKDNRVPSKFDYQILDSAATLKSPLDVDLDHEQLQEFGEKLANKNNFTYDFAFDSNPEKIQLVVIEYLGLRYEARFKFRLAGKDIFHEKSLRLFKDNGLTGAGDPLFNQCRMSGESSATCKTFIQMGRTDFSYCVEQKQGEVDLKIDMPGRRFNLPDKFFLEISTYIHSSPTDSFRIDGPPTMTINRIDFICGGKECEREPITVTIPLTYVKGRYYSIHIEWFEEKTRGNKEAVIRRYGTMRLPNKYSFSVGDTKAKERYRFVLPWGKRCVSEDDAQL